MPLSYLAESNTVHFRVWTVIFGLAMPRLERYWPVAFLLKRTVLRLAHSTLQGSLDGSRLETVAPACALSRDRCCTCGAGPLGHDAPVSQSSMNCLRSPTGPVSFERISEVLPIRQEGCAAHQLGSSRCRNGGSPAAHAVEHARTWPPLHAGRAARCLPSDAGTEFAAARRSFRAWVGNRSQQHFSNIQTQNT